jgi:hypothetical protein
MDYDIKASNWQRCQHITQFSKFKKAKALWTRKGRQWTVTSFLVHLRCFGMTSIKVFFGCWKCTKQ